MPLLNCGLDSGSLCNRRRVAWLTAQRPPQSTLSCRGGQEGRMTKTFVCMVTAALLAASGAFAGERPLDAGLGAVSGAVFLGPVGAIAGGVIGYTKGPAI